MHGILISVFTFSAIGYSRLSRGVGGFVAWENYALTAFVTFTLFLLLRLFDEVKDYEDDVKFRAYLPLPRGLVSLREIKNLTIGVIVLQIMVLAIFQPMMLPIYGICLSYMLLMRLEFFIPDWLRDRQIWYIVSHMLIIPLVDVFASSTDWKLEGSEPPFGLIFFFIVSFLNGMVLEFGRKLRTSKTEERGVVSYTKMWGLRGGIFVWVGTLLACLLAACAAASFAEHPQIIYFLLAGTFIICAIPAFLFLKKPTEKMSKIIEHASGVWTLLMYLLLGGGLSILSAF